MASKSAFDAILERLMEKEQKPKPRKPAKTKRRTKKQALELAAFALMDCPPTRH